MENLNLVRKLAWSFNQMTGVPYEELFSEACLGYAEALQLYDPNRGAEFTSFAWALIRNKLRTFTKNEQKYSRQINITTLCPNGIKEDEFTDWLTNETGIEEEVTELIYRPFKDFVQELPKEARTIVEIILRRQDDLPNPAYSYHVREILREEGLSWPKIWKGIKALKITLNHV